ncbi:MAG: hypothetical protein V4596_08055 [Bdellovibrionota bacterium]
MKLLLAIATLFVASGAFASNIEMYDNGASMAVQPVELVVVQGNDLWVRSSIRPCPALPGGAQAEVYECYTSREKLSAHLNDMNILSLPDSDLSKYITSLGQNFDCANRSTPSHIKYKGVDVIWFSGILLSKTR